MVNCMMLSLIIGQGEGEYDGNEVGYEIESSGEFKIVSITVGENNE